MDTLEEIFKNADKKDFDYILDLLKANKRHIQDEQTGYWTHRIEYVRKALNR